MVRQGAGAAVTHIGERIRAARTYAGLTQRDLAAAVGVSVRTVSLWETGRRTPSSRWVAALADACGVGVEYLFRRTVRVERIGRHR